MIRFILVAILVFILIRMIGKSIFSFYEGIYDPSNGPEKRRKEGEVTIESKANTTKRISKSDGEYVDYEEIK